MFEHLCNIDDMTIIGQRSNPLNEDWNEWTLVICTKCKKVYEWQHHSEEQMHGGDLAITAIATDDYLHYKYNINEQDIPQILNKKKKIRRYDRYKKIYFEDYA
ncbi:hypothetical protein [Methylophilus sp. OH31]|uniref:hypothetical protein n=1 Tax=Methylophilus sp. OH31 TaxID=1387312 RepID=UPI0004660A43|nr:hypothetical protein [Methylophilus sp. OH31]